jgi:hypothetical protein
MDALAHLSPEVQELRKWVTEVGLGEAVAAYRVPATTPLEVSGD